MARFLVILSLAVIGFTFANRSFLPVIVFDVLSCMY